MDHLRNGPLAAAYRMNRVHLMIIPLLGRAAARRLASRRPIGPMRPIASGYVVYMPGTQTCVFIGQFLVQCPGTHT